MEQVIEFLSENYVVILTTAIPFIAGIIRMVVKGDLDRFTRETVSAVYKVSINAANELQDSGLEWLKSEEGIEFRRQKAAQAYDLMPSHVGKAPVGLVLKAFITKQAFTDLVESAFQQMSQLATRLEFPPDIPEEIVPRARRDED